MVDADRRLAERELAEEVWVCHKTVLHILHDILGYRKLAARWILHEISEVQQWHRYAVAQVLLDRYQMEGDDFLGWIVAKDETWGCLYQPNLKRESNEWKHPGSSRPKEVRPIQFALKAILIVAYDTNEALLHYGISLRQTANTATTACSCSTNFVQRSGETTTLGGEEPHHSWWHTAAAVTDLLHRWRWEILKHPPYSHDMNPCDYDLLAKVKEPLRGNQ